MMNNKITIVLLLMCIVLLVACEPDNNSQEDVIRLGFSVNSNISESTPWVSIAMECKMKQSQISQVNIYVGHESMFIDSWNQNVWGSNPGYGKFVVERNILDENRSVYLQEYFDLDDFGDDKYLIKHIYDNEIPDKIISVEYEYSIKDTIDFNDIDIKKGFIQYKFCLVNNKYQIITESLNFSIGSYAKIGFVVEESSVIFSEWNGF